MHQHLLNRKAPSSDSTIGIMRRTMALVLVSFVSLLAPIIGSAALPAFPGAEGAGALAVGGRGGVVCKVTNLNDSGPGTLRECVNMSVPRTVTFGIGGTIVLNSTLDITNPYITIAGQTAPGGGIQIRASKTAWTSGRKPLVRVLTHDVIIRYLRVRAGAHPDRISNANQGWSSSIYNVIWDHISLSWSFSGTNWSAWQGPREITLQNSLLAESRVNILTGAASGGAALGMANLDFHNNLIANASHRNPLLKNGSIRFVNNIVYNWSAYASRTSGGVHGDFINNLYKPIPGVPGARGQEEIHFNPYTETMYAAERVIQRDPSMYVEGNRGGQSGMDPNTDNWSDTRWVGPNENDDVIGLAPAGWRRSEPLPAAGIAISSKHVDQLEKHLLSLVGASQRVDCKGNWVSNRDPVDARIVAEYHVLAGVIPSASAHEDDFGGYPVLHTGVPCIDTSGDGVPDEWATANGLNPMDPSLGTRVHESGYTYLELYLNGIAVENRPPAPPVGVLVE